MSKIILTSEEAISLWASEETDTYEQVEQVYEGEWRWGTQYDIIIKDKTTGKLYSGFIQVQTGDNYCVSWENGPVTFDEVEKVEKITYEYKKVK